MKKLLLTAVLAFATVAFNASALDFAITGTGATQTQGSQRSAFSAELRLEKFVTTNISVAYVQGICTAAPAVRGTSELLVAYNKNYSLFGIKNQAYVGAGGRIGYGDAEFGASLGPVAGNRLFLKDNVYVLTQVNYDVGVNRATDNVVRYSVGLGARF
jgi:hypothetical protein